MGGGVGPWGLGVGGVEGWGGVGLRVCGVVGLRVGVSGLGSWRLAEPKGYPTRGWLLNHVGRSIFLPSINEQGLVHPVYHASCFACPLQTSQSVQLAKWLWLKNMYQNGSLVDGTND